MELHDPGRKVRLRMLPGVEGHAEFSPCGQYRYWLSREWQAQRSTDAQKPYALWVGMNPSTAEAAVDDPTIRKEMTFTKIIRRSKYLKVNVMDYRATSPKDLLRPGVVPCSPDNVATIKSLAVHADIIIVSFGKLPKKLQRYGEAVISALSEYPLWCLGCNNDGSPKHPLYLAHDTRLVPYSPS